MPALDFSVCEWLVVPCYISSLLTMSVALQDVSGWVPCCVFSLLTTTMTVPGFPGSEWLWCLAVFLAS